LSAISAFFLLSFSLSSSATPNANRQDLQLSNRLKPRGSSWSSFEGKIIVRKGGTIMERPGYHDEDLVPMCAGKYAKVRRCELSCRCNGSGKVLCGIDLGFQFATILQRPLPAEKEAHVQAELTNMCTSLCACSLLSHLEPEDIGFHEDKATASGTGPSLSWAGIPTDGAGPSSSGARPSTRGSGSSKWVELGPMGQDSKAVGQESRPVGQDRRTGWHDHLRPVRQNIQEIKRVSGKE
jgi:hypothetical protein